MALIECPECKRKVSDAAIKCPGCGYLIRNSASQENSFLSEKNIKRIIIGIVCVAVIAIVIIVSGNSDDGRSSNRGYTSNYSSDYSGGYSSSSKTDASSIFNNLEIDDFSCSLESHWGDMSCQVTNNNSFTVNGYFRVNFYDASGNLLYNQLMSLPDVAPGETVVCSTMIPKDDYPHDYSRVGFSQASLVESD